MQLADTIKAITKVGGNTHAIARITRMPIVDVTKSIEVLKQKYNLAIFAGIMGENLKLQKILLICKNSKLKLSTSKKLFFPIENLFRADLEENKFMLVVYSNQNTLNSIKDAVKKLRDENIVECEIFEITVTKRYYRDISCFDFNKNTWICDKLIQLNKKGKEIRPDEEDINLVVKLQVNPSIPYYLSPHYIHVKHVIQGFMYTLGNNDIILDIITDKEIVHPNTLWTAKISNGYLMEIHTNYKNLDEILQKIKDNSKEIFIVPKAPSYAEGYTIPYEIFKSKKWEFPKIILK
ncbi:hypothetical protein [Acidianus sp. HS-5]|uniref:hypothetical protein n=1 Tax=Acidianus sp. HS-5 TaxID=2886040 RepID=UPI001F3B888D|nr:hypothetical protein [Acidianus sp. HS-5]BDC18336.1 hypothetical protein HS5_12260 [Acidianus sp. HS-5]